jgi:hypothetical protein
MVWCDCPAYCKGGREVSKDTYRNHNPHGNDASRFGVPLQRFLAAAAGSLAVADQNDRDSGKGCADDKAEGLPGCSKRLREITTLGLGPGGTSKSVEHSFLSSLHT